MPQQPLEPGDHIALHLDSLAAGGEAVGRHEGMAVFAMWGCPGDQAEVLAGSHTGPGGTIEAFLKLEGPTRQILQRVLFSGDFFVTPPRIVFDLEARLLGTRIDEIGEVIDKFFADNDVDMLSVAPADFQAAIGAAIDSAGKHV